MPNNITSFSRNFIDNLFDEYNALTRNQLFVRNNYKMFNLPNNIKSYFDEELKEEVFYKNYDLININEIIKLNLTTELLKYNSFNHINSTDEILIFNKLKVDSFLGLNIVEDNKTYNVTALVLIEREDTQKILNELKELCTNNKEILIILIKKSKYIYIKDNLDIIETNTKCLNVGKEIIKRLYKFDLYNDNKK